MKNMIEILAREIICGKFIAFKVGGFAGSGGGGAEYGAGWGGGIDVAMLRDCL